MGAAADPLDDRLFTGKISTALFKNMIAPMLNYRIKGVLWYQGESNTSKAFEYFALFERLITDWRNQWQQGDFPFIYTQLPNFVEVNIESTKYDWAYLRETQLKTLSVVPNTRDGCQHRHWRMERYSLAEQKGFGVSFGISCPQSSLRREIDR